MNAKADPRKHERIAEICQVYANAPQRDDEIVFSVDEMTGIQALERIVADLPMSPGKPLAREFEYQRHGTQTLVAAMNVVTGAIDAQCGETRTEEDFATFIAAIIARNPGYATYRFVLDQLNTHKSEALVRLAADRYGLPIELGEKGKHGVLQSMQTREDFLAREGKRVVFHYTPRHASWMNQIEIWFGIVNKKVVRRGNFHSTADLRDRLLSFTDYFNTTMARPFRWTYRGTPLVA
ncbi:MAG: transposase [Chromatiaceae bacterium]